MFFINGRYFSGNQPIKNFRRLINEELTKANARIAAGTRLEDYYTAWVLERGETSL